MRATLNARLEIMQEPAELPLLLNEVKKHLRLGPDRSEDDAYLYSLIRAATVQAELHTNRVWIQRTYALHLDRFPPCRGDIELPKPPLAGVTSVTYLDADGASQTLDAADYVVEAPNGPVPLPGRVRLAKDKNWPATHGGPRDVDITFLAGVDEWAKVPDVARQAMLLTIGFWYDHRDDIATNPSAIVMPNSARALLNLIKLPAL